MSDLGYFFSVIKPNDMLANPFLWCEDDKFFPDFVKNRHFIFAIFEAESIRKIQLLHQAKI
jgi:hypothetical protein